LGVPLRKKGISSFFPGRRGKKEKKNEYRSPTGGKGERLAPLHFGQKRGVAKKTAAHERLKAKKKNGPLRWLV